mmetsp:Transcript_14745/g.26969  ORF Transcript_14745/g.26969 Transcript_14745/m.26969 type:complete len:111 (-) Transcript_14745:245-577(-)
MLCSSSSMTKSVSVVPLDDRSSSECVGLSSRQWSTNGTEPPLRCFPARPLRRLAVGLEPRDPAEEGDVPGWRRRAPAALLARRAEGEREGRRAVGDRQAPPPPLVLWPLA